jgi:hypothetical protein
MALSVQHGVLLIVALFGMLVLNILNVQPDKGIDLVTFGLLASRVVHAYSKTV